ncbi:fibrillarin-like rRNA/tRNA 2'-O-methyltransferase [Candidatus Woesearchaeota archaeon]|nr:fibrillarin-like rRNA/tRNA 2'-O-methyltransferase [Candidatus Woesearchaeota archaeon]
MQNFGRSDRPAEHRAFKVAPHEESREKVRPHRFQGVFETRKGKRPVLLTRNLVPGKNVYGEDLVTDNGVEYREWNPTRSKLGAAIAKQASQIGIYPGSKVLYLGASTGTTPSHVSDIVGEEGFVFALDFAPRTTRELVYLCEQRKNMAPILGDARQPQTYSQYVTLVDAVFQDIAQRDQAEIFIKNCDMYLKDGGFGLLAVKSRSVDIGKKPRQIFAEIRAFLESKITIVDYRELDPFEKDHCIFVCKKK